MKKIIHRIKTETRVPAHSVHGFSHWERVADYGRVIAKNEDVNERIITLFAFFHDCQRLSEGEDPEHGPRAAKFVKTFSNKELGLDQPDMERLIIACRHHTHGCETDDLTIMASWDSDRLDLERIGIIPDPKYLFTATAKRIAINDYYK